MTTRELLWGLKETMEVGHLEGENSGFTNKMHLLQ